ncbi:MAG: hypothetical protein OEW17_00890 [Gemmatimonadota bacterium]|nr:hypothetical protein [Gemmatimonadota bacterium]
MRRTVAILILLGCAGAVSAAAQEPVTPADSVAASLSRIAARLDTLETGACPAGPAVATPPGNDSVSVTLRRLNDRLERLIAARCGPVAAVPVDQADELAALRAAAEAVAAGAGPAGQQDTLRQDTVTFAPQRRGNLLNPEISATGDIRFFLQDQSPQQDNFALEGVEVALQANLDPYSAAKIIIGFEGDDVGIEEGYLYYSGLPGKLRVDAGLFRQPLGDLNRSHVHALPETDYPLVYQRYLGEEGLAGAGISLYTTLPFGIAGGTHEIWVQGTTSDAEELYAGGTQPTLLGRLLNFWQLSRSTYMQLGVTGTGGNNADADLESRLLGADFRITWRPPETGGRRELTFRAEGYRLWSNEGGFETIRYGGFADLSWRASRRWILGVRGDWLEAARGAYATEWAAIPTITWWQSEFVYLRLEGRHEDGSNLSAANQLRLQAVFAMGPHKHEAY